MNLSGSNFSMKYLFLLIFLREQVVYMALWKQSLREAKHTKQKIKLKFVWVIVLQMLTSCLFSLQTFLECKNNF